MTHAALEMLGTLAPPIALVVIGYRTLRMHARALSEPRRTRLVIASWLMMVLGVLACALALAPHLLHT